MKTILKEKWDKLFIKLEGSNSQWEYNEVTFELLFQNYFYDENRHYHNAQHIRSCLENLDDLKKWFYKNDLTNHNLANWLAIELAIWFHDYIYDTRKNNNEELSALLAKQFILGIADNVYLAGLVETLILFTKHNRKAISIEEKIVSDIDLFVLGDYGYHEMLEDGYVDKIRKEYNWVPNFIYYPGRLKIIDNFFNRNRIFYTDYFHDELNLEKEAKINIAKEIEIIQKILKFQK